ncbi:MAG: hypothetical protein PHZ04_04630 [Patescibacteria group bacterium]|nr:hypothetical protein [Patescibacteria group bacterium]MDD5294728.1 hypothetical protein [Patescibacteria group bacterium]MDD5554956.1 hypothetical protein [Patescibacteria group bacterium]
MGPLTAIVYFLLMSHAYGSQILKIYRTRETMGLSLSYYRGALTAVSVRVAAVGLIIFSTHNITAIALGLAEIVVLLGLTIIPCQMWWYKSGKKKFGQYPVSLLLWDFFSFIKSSDK